MTIHQKKNNNVSLNEFLDEISPRDYDGIIPEIPYCSHLQIDNYRNTETEGDYIMFFLMGILLISISLSGLCMVGAMGQQRDWKTKRGHVLWNSSIAIMLFSAFLWAVTAILWGVGILC